MSPTVFFAYMMIMFAPPDKMPTYLALVGDTHGPYTTEEACKVRTAEMIKVHESRKVADVNGRWPINQVHFVPHCLPFKRDR